MTWSKSLLQKLEKEGRIKKVDFPKEPEKKIVIPKEIGPYKLHIISVLKKSGLEFQEEFRFDEIRKFRFDWAIEKYRIAIEYEGIFSEKSGHTTISGYTKDVTKYNLATKLGWQILRYTADNYLEIENDLKLLIEKNYDI
ncbi:hypothetical protein AB670_00047 [Chryseobacterium sp. MOF25P]|uniref:hypothetical protein n=1 Tax=unclassified Chryseobacterium TaxID=2593645 RepID=UPI000805235C|nr:MULTISPECIES: hypothetical protein [unclassified Chryseobacterium]OBW43517.1 hypothetical protein AB670_00047 [Chryseobacterium sp. MOF25P]OBW46709.1 hypothetical protein AB671_01204 [Chryseobacterium sp. BGARF1]